MEKKGNRTSPATRNTATDSKKDGVSSKQWPRGSRRRESTVSSLSSKNEPSRKPQPQRVKTLDKRPKPRGSYYAGPVARNETPWLEDQQAELGSVFLPGSKKQSLNHLLNFSYTPRDGYPSGRTSRDGKSGRMLCTRKHKYNKEHFLQANCQFIVNESGDYKPYLNNPDALVDWSLIEQVTVQVSEYPSCPICLYPPVAAKMTRCGHIYCWSCVLHYLSLSDKPSRKCPICYEPLEKQDLKSVVAIPHATFNVNETITFKLMKRPRGGSVAYPDDYVIKGGDDVLFHVSERDARDVHSKLLLANDADVLAIVARERRELEVLADEDGGSPESCFIEQAELLLKEREDAVLDSISTNISRSNGNSTPIVEALDNLEILDDAAAGVDVDESDVASPLSKCHYFYQAADGQHIYLHAINARMLEHTYGSLEHGPKTLTGAILEKEGGSMTEELRKRLRYLRHLPLTCQFEVAEIQLKSPVVDKDTLDYFQDQLDIRRKRRQHRAKEEKRREKRIEIEENKRIGKYPVPNLRLDSDVQFPEFAVEPRFRTESESTLPSERSGSPDCGVGSEGGCVGPSFATMLAKEKKQPPSWPILKSSGPEPLKLISVTGAKMKAGAGALYRPASDSDPEPEGYEPVPSFNASFGDAIAQALQQAEKTEEEEGNHTAGKKKKKSKQKVLFTTNMAYSGN
ncbi:unnamed protein product [Phaedon cochleariae]|uniref:E3 ubiquitin-protein ligase RNF10 n=1 Tax=Phaedon cochleariae TaxID=80249 RepID=A0A9P0DQJ7_PHACE|nr:unnamed protein product [Phaedon cochleariae]